MEDPILITWLRDFDFCPRSIYFHNLYGEKESLSFQEVRQINGTKAHETVDRDAYSTRKEILSGITVFSEDYFKRQKEDEIRQISFPVRTPPAVFAV